LAWGAGIALAALGVLAMPLAFWAGFGLLAAAGVALSLTPGSGLTPSAPPTRWAEAAGVAGLFLFALAIRFWRLGSVPPGPAFVESVMGLDAKGLMGSPYTAHLSQPQAAFPSLVYYQGLAVAAKFGWGLATLRAAPAFWGALSVLSFYFLLRQFSAPATALLFALLFSVDNLHLTLSRLFFPGSLLFFSVTATAALVLIGARHGRFLPFLAAGLTCGLALHGYVPGRMVPGVFLVWVVGLWWFQRRAGVARFGPVHLLLFAGGTAIAAAPVLFWALAHPGDYWALVQHNGGGGLLNFPRWYLGNLPAYLQMFYTRPDGITLPTDGLAFYPVLRPDWLVQALLPAGLLLAAVRPRAPLSWLIVGGFFVGLVPAAVAGNYPAPCTRRALLALPFAYAAAALAWQRLADAAPGAVSRRALWMLGLLLAGLAAPWSVHQYFVGIMSRPSVRANYTVAARLMGRDAAAHPGEDVRLSFDLAEPGTIELVHYKDTSRRSFDRFEDFLLTDWGPQRPVTAYKQLEDMLCFPQAKPQLLFLAPYLQEAVPWLRTVLPGTEPKVLAERRESQAGLPAWDPFAPETHYVRLEVGADAAGAFNGMVDLTLPPYAQPGGRVACWSPGFAQAHAGRRLDLGGLLVQPNAGADAELRLGWPGWRLEVDGKPRGWGRSRLDVGSHRLRLVGTVPSGAKGPLPLTLDSNNDDLAAQGRLLPIDPRFGLAATLYHPGDAAVAELHRHLPIPVQRFWPPEGISPPFEVRLDARLGPPAPGRYEVGIRPPYRGKIFLDDKLVFDSLRDGEAYSLPSDLGPKRAARLRVECRVDQEHDHVRTLIVDVREAGESGWTALPWDWVQAP
jgi:4-amino-4-deoxy-L-arabinose transferase-like glycosyltransferase